MTFLVRSNLFVSLCAASLYTYYSFLLKKDFFLSTPLFILSATFFAYNFMRLASIFHNDSETKELKLWYIKHKIQLILISLLLLLFLVIGMLDLNSLQLLSLGIGLIIVLLYERVFFKSFSLRKIPYIKPIVISLCWSLICVGLHLSSVNLHSLLVFIDSFTFILILSLLFDLKDSDADKKSGLKSLTHFLKSPGAIKIALVLTCLYLLISFFYFDHKLWYTLGIAILIVLSTKSLRYPIIFCLITDGTILYKALLGIYLF